MTEHADNDKEYENYMNGGSGISELYQKTVASGPSPDIDNAILSTARRAVNSNPRPVSPFGYRWMVPTSLAAILVLTISVVMLQPPPQESVIESDLAFDDRNKFNMSESHSSAEKLKHKADTSAPSRKTEQQSYQEKTEVGKKRQVQDDRSDILAKQASNARLKEEQIASAPQPIPAAEPAINGKIAETEQRSDEITPESKTASADKAQDDSLSSTVGSSYLSASPSTPEKWLIKIQKLLNEKKMQQAIGEFKAFKKAFPDYKIDFVRFSELERISNAEK